MESAKILTNYIQIDIDNNKELYLEFNRKYCFRIFKNIW